MDEEVFLTGLQGGRGGWQMDGPSYPGEATERQFNHRWFRFKDPDVARFYRDHLSGDVRRELNWLQQRWDSERPFNDDSDAMPSLVQLRSLLLNETPTQLAKVAKPAQFLDSLSRTIGDCLAVIRTSEAARWERLIPAGQSSPFVAGLERELGEFRGPLLYVIQLTHLTVEQARDRECPEIVWGKAGKPPGEFLSFGWVIPQQDVPTTKRETVALNWNSQATVFLP
jgi:hypothetical protein